MNLKEFDAKQFLLEKGEQVGLGVALTLMVLMLILSLFMPSKGLFSGSPASKAKELDGKTKQLETALSTNQPGEKDLPEKREGKLINLDTAYLMPDNYATEMWFEPRMKENKARRPPKIYNVEEAVAEVAHIPVDTYIMRLSANPPSILVLQDKERRGAANAGQGGMNPFQGLGNRVPGMGSGAGAGNPMMQRTQQLLGNNSLNALNRLQGAADNADMYETRWLPLDDWNQQQLTAHQVVPCRMAIIAGSFPYKKQIEEHKAKLRLKTTEDVLNETIGEKDKQTAAFDFRGLEVERMEVDAEGNKISDWADPQLKESYQLWLQRTYLPFEPEDPKYESVEPNGGRGLVMPLLREFHANRASNPNLPMMFPGMMMGGGKGMPMQPNQQRTQQTPNEEAKPNTKYTDVAKDLTLIKKTLDDIERAKPKAIAAAKKFQKAEFLNAFDAASAIPVDKNQTQSTGYTTQGNTSTEGYVPDYVLVRVVDVTIDPGKYYRYRIKIKMANPNYQNANVASPEYKEKETLESSEWYEIPGIVKVPQELFYYVVDEAQGMSRKDLNALPKESAQYRQLKATAPSPTSEQLAFQFHRWIESTQQSRKDPDQIYVGEWAVADRVFVGRGEYIGRKVNIDIPIWKPSQNTFILPTEDQKINRRAGKPNTGIDVDFGLDPQENNFILVDFEGGRGLQAPSNSKVKDDSAVEVLMLSPEGKLLSRNSVKDAADDTRIKRREAVLKRIQDVREGKAAE